MVQRCVIIQRDENGFGLTVSGDNPVFVQMVKEGEPPQMDLKLALTGKTHMATCLFYYEKLE